MAKLLALSSNPLSAKLAVRRSDHRYFASLRPSLF
jgi:hypothetical protein